MSDIFREVDEDLRREQLQILWKRYGVILIAAAIIIVVGTAGYRGWNWYQARQAAAAGEQYFDALALAEAGKMDEAATAFNAIAADRNAYSILARLRAAALLASHGDNAGAEAAYAAIAGDGRVDTLLRNIAALRAAYLAIGNEDLSTMEARLGDLLQPTNQFRHGAREIMALTALKADDVAGTAKWADMALADAAMPQNLRQRLELILSVIASERAAKKTS